VSVKRIEIYLDEELDKLLFRRAEAGMSEPVVSLRTMNPRSSERFAAASV
jgi:hypothetical protein